MCIYPEIKGSMNFLAREPLYDTIKPYSLRFDPPDSTPRHNLVLEPKEITIRNARLLNPTIEQHGFTLTSFPTKMDRHDFEDLAKIEMVYAAELEAHLKNLFQAQHVRVIDYAIRKRDPEFPISTGSEYKTQQPAALVHIDFSHNEGISMLKTLYGNRADEVLGARWQIINAWRPLHGPLFDWPLAVCDAGSFDPRRDSQETDAVYPEWAYENVLVHYHPDQKWYYFPEMEDTETMLFKCTDSDNTASGREYPSSKYMHH
ncbi:hypothetical protein LCI18_005938 [Fusarium solani-melongenae]|uniref:Uncharacterized protein n=1 Tax=Fusarium solani subsp. cucurbitae TaxID=2747967 RepID=A0ACD3Z175_FUSSC|nr:hypothetical protein LCI18_005938 [Fusarium solani-melongenae]